MEAINRGAKEAGGRSVGRNIALPAEQAPICMSIDGSRGSVFCTQSAAVQVLLRFHGLPSGLGTLDELFEALTRKFRLDAQKPVHGPWDAATTLRIAALFRRQKKCIWFNKRAEAPKGANPSRLS